MRCVKNVNILDMKLDSIIEVRPLDDYNGKLNAPSRTLTERKKGNVLQQGQSGSG